MAMHFSTIKRHLFALLAAIGGSIIMVTLILAFNKPSKKAEMVVAKSRILDVRPTQKQQASADVKPKTQPKPQQAKADTSALPSFSSMLGGIAMNIPELSFSGIIDDATSLLEEVGDDTVMSEQSVDTPPKVTSRTPMEYPSNAAKEGLSGYVVVNLLVGTDGNVEMVKVLESQPSGVFDDAAVEGVKSWKFSPAKYKGKPVKLWAKQKIKFN